MKAALIVLNYNDFDNTKKYVEIMKNYDIIQKIIIVDNNSTDGKIDELKNLENEKIDVIVSDKNGGYAYGNNFGLKYIDEKYNELGIKYVIISNPDVFVEEVAIEACIKELEENSNTAIVSPRMYFVNGPARRSAWKRRTFLIDIANSTRITEIILYLFFKKGEYSKKDFKQDKLKVDNIAGSFFVARRDYFREVGYFDDGTFLFFEEDILGARLAKKGYDIYSLNNYKFIHYDSKCIGRLFSIFKKQDILFESRKYFHRNYNSVKIIGIILLEILRLLRKVELVFEILTFGIIGFGIRGIGKIIKLIKTILRK